MLTEYARKSLQARYDVNVQHGEFWLFMSPRVRDSFFPTENNELGLVDDSSTHLLNRFARLFYEKFNCLWPMLSDQQVDLETMHPLLYLTIVSIGAMYFRDGVNFGSVIHENLRTLVLASSPMFVGMKTEPLWLLQSIHIHEAGALYFGHSRAFSVSQQLGSMLIFACRRLNLFSSTSLEPRSLEEGGGCEPAMADESGGWVDIESRRRLAFGVFRIDVYRSTLLNTRPLMSYEEFSINAPIKGRGNKDKDDRVRSEVSGYQQMGSGHEFRELVALALDREEELPAMTPAEHEMLIFALHEVVWKYSSHNDHLRRRFDDSLPIWLDENLDEKSGKKISHTRMSVSHDELDDGLRSTEDQLDFTTHEPSDRYTDCVRLLYALRKWKRALTRVQSSNRLENQRSVFLSGLMAYHTAFLRLNAPLERLHQIQCMAQTNSTFEQNVLQIAKHWAGEDRACAAVKHACAIWFIISEEMGRPLEKRALFNLFSFLALHHSSVVIWTYAGLHSKQNVGSSGLTLKLGRQAMGRPDLVICREHNRELLVHFSSLCEQVCSDCALNKSFASSALAMARCSFPL